MSAYRRANLAPSIGPLSASGVAHPTERLLLDCCRLVLDLTIKTGDRHDLRHGTPQRQYRY